MKFVMPMTQHVLKHYSVRAEVLRDDTCVIVKHFDLFKVFYYKSATMLDVEQHNTMVCDHSNLMGYNVDIFMVKE
jgi:hypothetical protein